MNVLCDSDFLISLVFTSQSTHKKAIEIHKSFKPDNVGLLNITKFELATVLSKKFSYRDMLIVLEKIEKFIVLSLSEEWEELAWEEFFKHKKKGISYVDCANLVVARELDWKIASFDTFYPKEVLV